MASTLKKQKVDGDIARRIYWHMIENSEIIDLKIPSINIPITLRNLLNFCYATDRDFLISRSDESEHPSYYLNSDELSHLIAEDGSLRFDRILPLVPPAPSITKTELLYYHQALESIELALSSYNRKHKDAEYELVGPLTTGLLFHSQCYLARHVNFLAKPKNTDSAPELFFAEAAEPNFRDDFEDPVFKISKMKPQLRGSTSGAISSALLVFHPDDVDCRFCNHPDCYESFSDDSE